jgi:hypothetical protein
MRFGWRKTKNDARDRTPAFLVLLGGRRPLGQGGGVKAALAIVSLSCSVSTGERLLFLFRRSRCSLDAEEQKK